MSTAERLCLPRRPWLLLLAIYLLLAVTYSVIQPLGRTPDETAHMQYVAFLAQQHRLPIWSPQGGGEAGYESQHPPLYYGVMALAYAVTTGMPENWRWHAMRWVTILLIGVPMFLISRRFFTLLWGEGSWHSFIAVASVMLMPMTLLYTAYVNPDAMAMLWASATLLLAAEVRVGSADAGEGATPSWRRSLLLGLTAGLAMLSKMSGAPALVIALAACLPAGRGDGKRTVAWDRCAGCLLVAVLVSGWWYARNAFYYGTPFIHTPGLMGSGLQVGLRYGILPFGWLVYRETFLSSWVQRGWFPAGFLNLTLYGLIVVMSLLAAIGLVRQRALSAREGADGRAGEARMRTALNLAGALLLLVFLGHQWAYWTVDVEFNAGGRYILVAMIPLVLLLLTGIRNLLGDLALRALWGWFGAVVLMNLVSVWNIWHVLNPRFAPGWRIFQFPPG